MTALKWIEDVLAALMLAIAVLSAARTAAALRGRRGAVVTSIEVAHLLMAIAMAGMLASGLATLPDTTWQTVFWLLTAWFACQVWREVRADGWRALPGGRCAPHLAHSAAMLYMTAAVTPAVDGHHMESMGSMSEPAMQSLDYPTPGWVFLLVLVGYGVWDLDRLFGRRITPADAAMPMPAAGAPALADPGAAPTASGGSRPTGGSAAVHKPPVAVAAGAAVPRSAPGRRPAACVLLLSTRVTVGCRIAMGVTMAFMLGTMI